MESTDCTRRQVEIIMKAINSLYRRVELCLQKVWGAGGCHFEG